MYRQKKLSKCLTHRCVFGYSLKGSKSPSESTGPLFQKRKESERDQSRRCSNATRSVTSHAIICVVSSRRLHLFWISTRCLWRRGPGWLHGKTWRLAIHYSQRFRHTFEEPSVCWTASRKTFSDMVRRSRGEFRILHQRPGYWIRCFQENGYTRFTQGPNCRLNLIERQHASKCWRSLYRC